MFNINTIDTASILIENAFDEKSEHKPRARLHAYCRQRAAASKHEVEAVKLMTKQQLNQ